jgi:hypothetical protein
MATTPDAWTSDRVSAIRLFVRRCSELGGGIDPWARWPDEPEPVYIAPPDAMSGEAVALARVHVLEQELEHVTKLLFTSRN